MNKRTYDYGILIENVLVKDLQPKLQSQRTVLLGSILKIDAVIGNKMFVVRFLMDDSESWETNKFSCEQRTVTPVSETVWPYLASVSSPQERVLLAKNPLKCEHLMQISVGAIVGFSDFNCELMGTVKYIGHIKGMGKGFGIKLHKKKINNNCSGSCAGIEYFKCPQGFGIFTSIDRINPQNLDSTFKRYSKPSTSSDSLDEFTKRNVATIMNNTKDSENRKSNYIDTKTKNEDHTQSDFEKLKKLTNPTFRTSLSVQNILDSMNDISTNTNNDFDQNSMIQSDNLYLMKGTTESKKKEIDLIDAIGGSWSGTTNPKDLEAYSSLRKTCDKSAKNEHLNYNDKIMNTKTNGVTMKASRNKSINPVSHLVSGSKTVPRKVKLMQEPESKNVNKNGVGGDFEPETNMYLHFCRPNLNIQRRQLRHSGDPLTIPENTFKGLFRISRELAHWVLHQILPYMMESEHTTAIPKNLRIVLKLLKKCKVMMCQMTSFDIS
ncbi:hypothetical protein FQA39_LY12020 [Lamprigera yunnana]|nr:hypothetical protein FQA39_LY12020 [Lamprigera yunnana]